ncbi:hypothetical protein [Novosphingobium sp. 18050]|uniref:hypothetical protein n=1 Tax=Novosphingobium sp. 18050 TaxID=2681398 RepID=UPI00135B1501|nr:hypothetical protein [Novosphingobium sp. 18050]
MALAAKIPGQVPELDLSADEMTTIDAELARQAEADAVAERGPYISDPTVVAELGRSSGGGSCSKLGRFAFGCFIQGRVGQSGGRPSGRLGNPFELHVAKLIQKRITEDLAEFQSDGGHINERLLSDAGSRLELVGIVNRMDRRFVLGPRSDVGMREDCGEISLIYRFTYSIFDGTATSRLPVTMNVVLPALPNDAPKELHPCQRVAQKWLAEMDRPRERSTARQVADLLDPKTGALGQLRGRDIDRIELNIQVFRKETSDESNHRMGSMAAYVIRVFRWDAGQFKASYLMNQIDRRRLLGLEDDGNSCDTPRPSGDMRAAFVKELQTEAFIRDIDNGTLVIPFPYLACRAISYSPGGPVRSGNSPFWENEKGGDTVITDDELRKMIDMAPRPPVMFRTVDDLRMRLNEQSCTGCHQTRAIAGFHFPGRDRASTPAANAVYLPGSPHFYGDQLRRVDFLKLLARGQEPRAADYVSGYASRPLNRYRSALAATQLIGGWGATCIMPEMLSATQRQWTCRKGLHCEQQYKSANAPGLGTCVADGDREIGAPMQAGVVTSPVFGDDYYERVLPNKVKTKRDVLIDPPAGPRVHPSNSFYVAHQEFYTGDITGGGKTGREKAIIVRDAKTGGFPSGMLRLSECIGLPREATCGLVASTGFNTCVGRASRERPLEQCFANNTSYSGMRACSASSPCRDDHICLKPIGYTPSTADELFAKRSERVAAQSGYDPAADFGQKRPGRAWLQRNGGRGDNRGVCIPPYFVFQFRSDKHPDPDT